MKAIPFLLFTILSISIYSQVITFDKTLQSTGYNNSDRATQIIQTDDEGYLLNLYNNLKFIKTNKYGYIEWFKEYPEITSSASKIQKTYDDGYVTVGNKLVNGIYDFCIIKLDYKLDTVWTKILGQPSMIGNAYSVIQLSDSTYVVSSKSSSGYTLRKIDRSGNIIIENEISGGVSLLYTGWLQNLYNEDFLFWKQSDLIRLDKNLNIIWTLPISAATFAYPTSDSLIICGSKTNLKKIDLNGNIIWDKSFTDCKAITELPDNKYLLLSTDVVEITPSKLVTIDSSGNIINEKLFEFSGKDIIKTLDGGIAMCGAARFQLKWPLSYPYSSINVVTPWLLKMNQNVEFTAINLLEPLDGYTLQLFNKYSIVWKANNVNYINIDYSTDNQNTWRTIINYYPAEADTFLWTVPELPSGNIYIRISDSFNPEIYDRSDSPQKTGYQSVDYIAANEIFMWLGNDGSNAHDPSTDASGFFWPGGEDATIPAIFVDGLVWGGKVNGEIRVNGNTYRYGLNSGYIQSNGLPSDPMDTKAKIFKLKKNWQMLPAGPERDRYEFDFLNWPVDIGAPWNDNNNDGVYTLGIDEPKIIGDETLFFVANDLDTLRSLYTYGSLPIGLEFQVTTFGYNSELLKDVVFKKFKLINKSSTDVTDMYLSYWTDDDLGFAADDYVGCDTLLNLGYTYNGDNYDEEIWAGYGTPPPVVGHLIVQAPVIEATASDSARYGNGWKAGFKNLTLTAFTLFISGSSTYADPDLGVYPGTQQLYNYMQGFLWDGTNFIDPNTQLPTQFCLAGDPVAGTGWNEWNGWPNPPNGGPGDRRYLLSVGKFNMASGDTQEVVIAILIKKGTDNLNSITELKNYAAQIQHWYDNDFVTDVDENNTLLPTEFSLSQNYPNPFNPSTSIQYAINSRQLVTLKVYDILGSEVATLVNQEQNVGNYKVDFNASHLSSGVYFYQIKAGEFIQSKKMILVR